NSSLCSVSLNLEINSKRTNASSFVSLIFISSLSVIIQLIENGFYFFKERWFARINIYWVKRVELVFISILNYPSWFIFVSFFVCQSWITIYCLTVSIWI